MLRADFVSLFITTPTDDAVTAKAVCELASLPRTADFRQAARNLERPLCGSGPTLPRITSLTRALLDCAPHSLHKHFATSELVR
jgi:hypothetical protein